TGVQTCALPILFHFLIRLNLLSVCVSVGLGARDPQSSVRHHGWIGFQKHRLESVFERCNDFFCIFFLFGDDETWLSFVNDMLFNRFCSSDYLSIVYFIFWVRRQFRCEAVSDSSFL